MMQMHHRDAEGTEGTEKSFFSAFPRILPRDPFSVVFPVSVSLW